MSWVSLLRGQLITVPTPDARSDRGWLLWGRRGTCEDRTGEWAEEAEGQSASVPPRQALQAVQGDLRVCLQPVRASPEQPAGDWGSPDAGGMFPPDFLITEQFLPLTETARPSTWILRRFVGMTHVGPHHGESYALWFGFACRARREMMRKREKFPPASGKMLGLSPGLIWKWGRGGAPSHRFSGTP